MSDERNNAQVLDKEMVERHIDELMRQFDTVQIFCTRHEGSHGTVAITMGKGDWYSRYGVTSRWVDAQVVENELE